MSESWHGTLNGYSNKGCRCERCKAEGTAQMRAWRAKVRDTSPPEAPAHGTTQRYDNYGCRCQECRRARRDRSRRERGSTLV